MSDPFDIFDPFAPLPSGDDAISNTREASDDRGAPAARDAARTAETPAPRTPRRWAAPRASAVPERPTQRPAPQEPESESESEPEARTAKHHERPEPAAAVDFTGSTALRVIALPEILRAVERLSDRGHVADLENRLHDDDPRLVMRFRPHSGPLGPLSLEPCQPWRFELRTAIVEHRSGEDQFQAVAGYTAGSIDDRFVVLGRVPVGSLTHGWVSERLVEFLERNLGRI